MKLSPLSSKFIATLIVCNVLALPTLAMADDHGKGKGRGQSQEHRNDDRRWQHDDHGRGHDDHGRRPIQRTTVHRTVVNRNVYIDRNNRYPSYLQRESDHRQQTKNEWRNIAIGAGAIALLGVLQKDNRLVFAGGAGALYSLYRYEQDRKSQSRTDRLRAQYFSQPYFVRDGHRYDRKTVTKGGQRYYQFVRG